MATIKFFIQSIKSTAGIYVRLREGRQTDAKAKTKFIVRIEDWSDKNGRPINLQSESLKKLNNKLDQFAIDLQNHYNNSVGKIDINSKWLKDFINTTEQPKLTDYFDYYFDFITKLENESFIGWSQDAINGYLTACTTIKQKIRNNLHSSKILP